MYWLNGRALLAAVVVFVLLVVALPAVMGGGRAVAVGAWI